jgi:hypothetical protein
MCTCPRTLFPIAADNDNPSWNGNAGDTGD